MELREYVEKLEVLDGLRKRTVDLPEDYRAAAIEILDRFEEIYDIELIESGRYPTF